MSSEKMTYVRALSYVLTSCEMPVEVYDKLCDLRDQTEKRNSAKSGKPTAKQRESADLAETLYAFMCADTGAHTVSEWMAMGEPFASMSNQKVSALMRALVSDNKVEKTVDKRKSYFKALAG